MTDIAQLGIQVDSRPAVKAVDDLDDLTLAAARAEDAVEDLGAASKGRLTPAIGGVGKASVLASQNTRMFAMQLSQVAQQTSATGNFVQALAIQLPDMTLGFGAVGIAAGILASVALPALASALMDGKGSADSMQDALDALSEATDDYARAVADATVPMGEMAEKYGTMAAAARDFATALAEVERVQVFDALRASIQGLTADLIAMVDVDAFTGEIVGYDEFAEALGVAENEAASLRVALLNLASAEGPAAQAEAARVLARRLDDATGGYANMNARAREVYTTANQIGGEAAKTQGATEQAAQAAGILASNMGAAYAQYAATRGMAAALADETLRAAQAAASLASYNSALSNAGQASGPDAARTMTQFGGGRFTAPVSGAGLPSARAVGGGGGGGGGADDFSPRLQALISELRTEREIEDEWYQENLAILQDRRAQELLGHQEHKNALVALEEEYQSRIAAIEAEASQRRLSETAGLFGALADIASAGGKKTAKAVAAFQAIEGTINAYGAAIKALNTPGISLAGRFAAYASVLAAGLKGVAAIRQAGGSAGGSGVSTAAQGITSADSAQEPLTVRFIGNSGRRFTQDEVEELVNEVFKAGTRGRNAVPGVVFA